MKSILIIGHPNSGKTELFNQLADQHATVGNWSGVTIDKQITTYTYAEEHYQLTDLPGIYSIHDKPMSEDEKITLQVLQSSTPNLVLNVINACQLERGLYLTSQLLTLNIPVIVILSMQDRAKKSGIHIQSSLLANLLQCPVINSHELNKELIYRKLQNVVPSKKYVIPNAVRDLPSSLEIPHCVRDYLTQHIEAHLANHATYHHAYMTAYKALLEDNSHPDIDLILADAHYKFVHHICTQVQTTKHFKAERWTARLDSLFLHRLFGLPFFFFIMYLMFFFAIHIGGIFQSFFDLSTQALFVQGTKWLMQLIHSPTWLAILLADGIGKGLNTTFTFIPVLAAMFFFLSFLENSGYMARAAFVMDRGMRAIGLPGKAFVPLIIGFGCNVPAILATRTLERKRDRILTTIMSPFMSCSARLTIYTVFISTFFPAHGENVIFSLYLLGIGVALFTGLMLRRTFLSEDLSPLILELPTYQPPRFAHLCQITWFRLSNFLKRAGKLIIPTCLIISALQLISAPAFLSPEPASLLSYAGMMLSPLFAPMGLTHENWPAVVGLLTGMLAKEVVISTMNTLYLQLSHITTPIIGQDIIQTLLEALSSIPQQLSSLGQSFLHPFSNQQVNTVSVQFHTFLQHYFHDVASVYAYLTFILLYLPCVSTMAAIKQEASSTLMWFSIVWSFFIAYSIAVLLYQSLTFALHPASSLSWIITLISLITSFYISLRYGAIFLGEKDVITAT